MKPLKILSKIIFCLPVLLIAYQIFYIIEALIFGVPGGLLGIGPTFYGFQAVQIAWLFGGFYGLIYIPFVLYQIIYLSITKNKLFKKLFIIEMVVIFLLEAPLLYQLIFHGF